MSLDIIKKNSLYKPIYNVISSIKFSPEIEFDRFAVAFIFKKEGNPDFQICFWLNENRVSCFVDVAEIIDDYLKDEKQSLELAKFIESFLSNSIKVIETKNKKGIIYYRKIYYSGLENEKPKVFLENQWFKTRYPWLKLEIIETIFKPWLGKVM